MTTPTTTTIDPLTALACPAWCTLAPGHPVDSLHDDGRESRGHGGPGFGEYLSGGADEYTDAGGQLAYTVQLDAEGVNITKPSELLDLATQAIAAAQWLEAHR